MFRRSKPRNQRAAVEELDGDELRPVGHISGFSAEAKRSMRVLLEPLVLSVRLYALTLQLLPVLGLDLREVLLALRDARRGALERVVLDAEILFLLDPFAGLSWAARLPAKPSRASFANASSCAR